MHTHTYKHECIHESDIYVKDCHMQLWEVASLKARSWKLGRELKDWKPLKDFEQESGVS